MNNNIGLRNSTDAVISKNETEKKDSVGEPPPPPPPRVKSKQTTEIITTREGRQFKNGIELFDKKSIEKELKKLTNIKPDSKLTEPEAQEYTNSNSRFSMPVENIPSNKDKEIVKPPVHSRFLMPVEDIVLDKNNQIPNNPNKFEYLNSTTVKNLATKDLHDACSKRNKGLFEYLIESGADVNHINKEGHTPLMIACQKGDSKTAKLLIKNGARVDFQFKKNSTALMHAIKSKNIDLINLILKNTKNINFENNDGDTALIMAVQNDDSKIASLLIEAGARIDQLTSAGESALSVACECNLPEMLDFLIGKLGHFNRNDNNFLSHYPLKTIIENGNTEAMSVLLKNGLPINALKEDSWRLIANASFYGKTEIARMLLEKCSSSLPLSPPGFLSRTPIPVYELLQRSLKSASGAGNKEIVRMLIEVGAKLDHIDSEGESATHYAIKKERPEVLLFLLQKTGKLTYERDNGKLFNELLYALDRPKPDPLIVDILLDFENDTSLKQGGVTYTVRFNELCNKFHNLLARSRIEKIDQAVMRDLTASLCTDFGLTYVVAKTLVEKIQHVKEIYSPDNPTFAAPTAKQLRMIFVESVVGDQRLQDLIRYDDQPSHALYANYQEAPDIAEKLIRRAAPQAGFIVMEAEAELKEQQATLGGFLTKITPAITSRAVREFMQEEGWHPLMVELVAESWESLQPPLTSKKLFEVLRDNLNGTEFVGKVEQLTSDASRHLLTQQMNRLTGIINS